MMQKIKKQNQSNLIWLGTIVNTHGLKGEVRILSNSDDLNEAFKEGEEFFLQDQQKLIVESYRLHRNFVLVMFKDIDTIEKAQKLKNKEIYKVSNLNIKEEFYLKDLIGAKVINDDQKELGIIIDLLHQVAYDSIVVKLLIDDNIINIPLIDEFFIDFDAKKSVVYVKLSEEFINANINS
ncbi:MAG: ribosome maturation factor RimM [Candidatus Hepatoplasma scabrum]|nr:MAG: ribosome maturation factor RimM [Candidatus Hepatoplasma sp.]